MQLSAEIHSVYRAEIKDTKQQIHRARSVLKNIAALKCETETLAEAFRLPKLPPPSCRCGSCTAREYLNETA